MYAIGFALSMTNFGNRIKIRNKNLLDHCCSKIKGIWGDVDISFIEPNNNTINSFITPILSEEKIDIKNDIILCEKAEYLQSLLTVVKMFNSTVNAVEVSLDKNESIMINLSINIGKILGIALFIVGGVIIAIAIISKAIK